jgi:hypothetical protein
MKPGHSFHVGASECQDGSLTIKVSGEGLLKTMTAMMTAPPAMSRVCRTSVRMTPKKPPSVT